MFPVPSEKKPKNEASPFGMSFKFADKSKGPPGQSSSTGQIKSGLKQSPKDNTDLMILPQNQGSPGLKKGKTKGSTELNRKSNGEAIEKEESMGRLAPQSLEEAQKSNGELQRRPANEHEMKSEEGSGVLNGSEEREEDEENEEEGDEVFEDEEMYQRQMAYEIDKLQNMTKKITAMFNKAEGRLILTDNVEDLQAFEKTQQRKQANQGQSSDSQWSRDGLIDSSQRLEGKQKSPESQNEEGNGEEMALSGFFEMIEEADIQSYLHLKIEDSMKCLLTGSHFNCLYLLKFADLVLEVCLPLPLSTSPFIFT